MEADVEGEDTRPGTSKESVQGDPKGTEFFFAASRETFFFLPTNN